MSEIKGFIAEIFFSHQGEGSWIGQRQLFIRFAGCRLQCDYCDTRWARAFHLRTGKYPDLQRPATSWGRWQNPLTVSTLLPKLRQLLLYYGPAHSVAYTGGEPLEQLEFLQALTTKLKRTFPRMLALLETNGAVLVNWHPLAAYWDFIALDIKLSSACGNAPSLAHYAHMLAIVSQQSAGCVKVVITPETPLTEVTAAARLARLKAPTWDFILQPVTGGHWRKPQNAFHLQNLSAQAFKQNPKTRMIPQVHRWLGML